MGEGGGSRADQNLMSRAVWNGGWGIQVHVCMKVFYLK